MVKKFDFKDTGTELEIAGNKFHVDITDPDTIERVMEFSREATKKAEELKGTEDYVAELRGLISYCLGVVDNILGKGSADIIFEGQVVSLAKAMSLLQYIVEVINTEKVDYFSAYSPDRLKRKK